MKERIRKLRSDLGLTQDEFAEKLGVSKFTIVNYELGRREPTSNAIRNICSTFDVREEWLKGGTGDMFVERDDVGRMIAYWARVSLNEKSDSFKRRFISVFSQLDDQEWRVMEFIAQKFIDEMNKDKQNKKNLNE